MPLSEEELQWLEQGQRWMGASRADEMSDEEFRQFKAREDAYARYAGDAPVAGRGNAPIAGYVATDDPVSDIRSLKSSIDQRITAPTARANWSTDPEFRWATSRQKSAEGQLQSSKQEAFYQNLLRMYGTPDSSGRPPESWSKLPPHVRKNLEAYAYNLDGFRDKISSGYESTGIIGPESAVGTGLTWLQSLPSMAYEGGRVLGNQASAAFGGRDDVYDTNFNDAANTALAPFSAAVKPVTDLYAPGYSPESAFSRGGAALKAIDKQFGDMPWDSEMHGYLPKDGGAWGGEAPSIAGRLKYRGGITDAIDKSSLTTGSEFLEREGVPGAPVLGALMDATMNPLFSVSGLKNANAMWKAGAKLPLAKWAGGEYGIDTALAAYNAWQGNR
jgi:hypothetical protein